MKKKIFVLLVMLFSSLSCGSSGSDDGPVSIISTPSNIELFDINNRGNASDIRVFFSFTAEIDNVKEYRLILVPDGVESSVTLNDFLNDGEKVQVVPSRRGEIKVNLLASLRDVNGNAVSNEGTYAVGVAAIHNDNADASRFAFSSATVTLSEAELRDLYISNNESHSVVIIDEVTGEFIGDFIAPTNGGLGQTQEMIINEDGNFLVTGLSNSTLKLYNGETGQFMRDYTIGYVLGAPTKTSIGPDGLIYVSQWTNNVNDVARFDYVTGAFVDEFVKDIDRAMGHAWDDEGNYYLTSFGTPSVIKYDVQGNELMKIGEGILQGPVNVWVDDANDGLFVVDWSVGMVREFELSSGGFRRNFITGMQRVEGFLFGRNNSLYLCDWLNNSVNEYDAGTGALRRIMQSDRLNKPNAVIYGPNVDPD